MSSSTKISMTNLLIYWIRILTLKLKVKDVEDFDENWQTQVLCQHPYVCKKLLGVAVCSQNNHDLDENWPANEPCQQAHLRIF